MGQGDTYVPQVPCVAVAVDCRIVVTDIYGGIEVRHPGAGTDWYDGEPWVKAMDLYPLLGDASWVGWSELARLDLDGPFGHVVGYLESNDGSSTYLTRLLSHGWRPETVVFAGPDAERAAAQPSRPATWTHDGFTYWYRPVTLARYFGAGTPWGHVLTVMRALAGRFGDDGVRLVAAFD
ncbi:hypothetical protein [Myceligenerans xiligouense]|uniref:Uncharacterized protein n=1 Tax=Myceligenerans xiligouense TaxID=253184 RepID=A0A3N4ZK85_9MICO|nr:hypothetical protein [Myceligenerans xiligouense]RPF20341.1 hypothetical protein EDD34_0929 [Myceligenerans xiligouense]